MTDGVMGAEAAAGPAVGPAIGPALAAATAGDVLSWYLNAQAGDFLRSLRQQRESGVDAEEAAEAARLLRRCARRISGTLWVYRPLADTAWADHLRSELVWLSATLALEHAYAARLNRLRGALHRLSGAGAPADEAMDGLGDAAGDARADAGAGDAAAQRSPRAARRSVSLTADAPQDPPPDAGGDAVRDMAQPPAAAAPAQREAGTTAAAGQRGGGGKQQPGGGADEARGGALTVGAARAGALLERQLTLARTRAHTAALQALGSSRFHAVADAVALLASEVPLDAAAATRPAELSLPPLAELAHRRLVEAAETLPLGRAGHPYNAEALVHGLAATPAADAPPASERQDAPWHQVRQLVRLRRYALEVLDAGQRPEGTGPVDADPSLSVRLLAAGQALERHRDASEAAAAAAAAARTPRIAPATAYALGVLHADQRHEVEAARFAFGRIWHRLVVSAS
ncbi:CHAD domain-containing protein [Streptomyces sp. NPDC059590]|uniref:CHAD domain-containing protein n=1 Tax=Streptomyces sp. NPDC059590 TaxID=3346877 RepID=UPI003691DC65